MGKEYVRWHHYVPDKPLQGFVEPVIGQFYFIVYRGQIGLRQIEQGFSKWSKTLKTHQRCQKFDKQWRKALVQLVFGYPICSNTTGKWLNFDPDFLLKVEMCFGLDLFGWLNQKYILICVMMKDFITKTKL